MNGILDGIRVLDLTQMVAGPLCTMLLGDLGADVIKVEPPDGDSSRGIGLNRACGESDYFLSVNRNKRSIVVNLKEASGVALVRALAAECDVLAENFRPGTLDRLGLGYETLRADNPRLIYCGMPGFPPSGPYADRPALDPIIQAMSGIMQLTGTQESGPLRTGILISDFVPPLFSTIGILAALFQRQSTALGQRVDVAMLDATVFSMLPREGHYFSTGKTPGRLGNAHYQLVPWNSYETQDGRFLIVVAHTDKYWRALLTAIGQVELAADARFRTNADRLIHRDELDALLRETFAARPLADWAEQLGAADALFAPVRDFDDVFSDPAVRDHMVATLTHPTAGEISVLNNPIQLSGNPASIRRPPPLLGQHTSEILSTLASRPNK